MGLRDYRKWKKQQEFLKFLSSYGITEEDLKIVPEALKMYKNGVFRIVKEPTEEQKKLFEEVKQKKNTPDDFMKQFLEEAEEFYPNGKPNKSKDA